MFPFITALWAVYHKSPSVCAVCVDWWRRERRLPFKMKRLKRFRDLLRGAVISAKVTRHLHSRVESQTTWSASYNLPSGKNERSKWLNADCRWFDEFQWNVLVLAKRRAPSKAAETSCPTSSGVALKTLIRRVEAGCLLAPVDAFECFSWLTLGDSNSTRWQAWLTPMCRNTWRPHANNTRTCAKNRPKLQSGRGQEWMLAVFLRRPTETLRHRLFPPAFSSCSRRFWPVFPAAPVFPIRLLSSVILPPCLPLSLPSSW